MLKHVKFLFVFCLTINTSFSVNADLRIDSIYPTSFKPGQSKEFTITGEGFDAQTRVAFFPDSGNNQAIIRSLDTPGTCYSLSKSRIDRNKCQPIGKSENSGFNSY
ncbi:MAG: hypothetical protein HQK75_12465 [Candidatus Magnetomorum sp.]|nr:hypothetical protein [Candidatus Magnetomorum sp.]